MKRYLWAIVAAALILAAGTGAFMGGKALAAANGEPTFLSYLAKELGLTPDDLNAKIEKAYQEYLQDQVDAGQISKETAQKLEERLQDGLEKGHVFFSLSRDWPFFSYEEKGHGHQGGITLIPFPKLADTLGLTMDQLAQELRSGKTPEELLQAAGKSTQAFIDEATASFKDRLQTLVQDGKITQEKAEQILQQLKARLQDWLQKPFPATPEKHPWRKGQPGAGGV